MPSDTIITVRLDPDPPTITKVEDLIKLNYISTCSVMYRRVVVKVPERYAALQIGEWPLHILHAQKGSIGLLAETMVRDPIHKPLFSSLHNAKDGGCF